MFTLFFYLFIFILLFRVLLMTFLFVQFIALSIVPKKEKKNVKCVLFVSYFFLFFLKKKIFFTPLKRHCMQFFFFVCCFGNICVYICASNKLIHQTRLTMDGKFNSLLYECKRITHSMKVQVILYKFFISLLPILFYVRKRQRES